MDFLIQLIFLHAGCIGLEDAGKSFPVSFFHVFRTLQTLEVNTVVGAETLLRPIETLWDDEHDDQKMHDQKRTMIGNWGAGMR